MTVEVELRDETGRQGAEASFDDEDPPRILELPGMNEAEFTALLDEAMAKVRGDDYAQSLTDPAELSEDAVGDWHVRYYGSAREVGYPDRSMMVLEANLRDSTIVLASGAIADYSTERGRLSCAAMIAGHRTGQRPTVHQVYALAAEVRDAEIRDGGGEFMLTGDAVDIVLNENAD